MCTRILWNNNPLGVIVGRTMDWPVSTEPVLTVFPRGLDRNGGFFGPEEVVKINPARWKSVYGSLVVTLYGLGTADGVNEKGLAAHMLYLNATDYGERDATKKGVQAGLWAQYLLDNAATVAEALALMEGAQPVMVALGEFKSNVHLAIEDASGDSAILEYIDGKLVVHHGRDYRVMTNDPPYDEQLANRAQYNFTDATRKMPLPGNVDPMDRFIRASYFLEYLPKPTNERAAIAGIFSIARNVSVPFGAPNKEPGSLYNTEYRTVADLTYRLYFFELVTMPNVLWMDFGKFDYTEGASVMVLNPDNLELSGNVIEKFEVAAKVPF